VIAVALPQVAKKCRSKIGVFCQQIEPPGTAQRVLLRKRSHQIAFAQHARQRPALVADRECTIGRSASSRGCCVPWDHGAAAARATRQRDADGHRLGRKERRRSDPISGRPEYVFGNSRLTAERLAWAALGRGAGAASGRRAVGGLRPDQRLPSGRRPVGTTVKAVSITRVLIWPCQADASW
jgi:hypothetical protein